MSHATQDIFIRPAQEGDLYELTRLGIGIQKLHSDGRPDIFREPSCEALKAFFEARIADDSHILVADTSNGPVGCSAAYLANSDGFEVELIATE